jgi:hypothetical protein
MISDLHGVSGRKMLDAMIAGQHDRRSLADLAHGRMRVKLPQLRQALTGYFDDHHGFLCASMLHRIDALTADIAVLDARIDQLIGPLANAPDKLDEIPGIGRRSAEELIAEIGVRMTVFPTAAHLVSGRPSSPRSTNSQPPCYGRVHRQRQPLVGRCPRRDRRRPGPHRHVPQRPLTPFDCLGALLREVGESSEGAYRAAGHSQPYDPSGDF